MSTGDCYEDISFILKELENVHYPAGPLFQRVQRYKASYRGYNELETIYNLVESHSPWLRYKAALRYEKLLAKDTNPFVNTPLTTTKDDIAVKCPTNEIEENVCTMLNHVAEMPKEWTVVQLTPQCNLADNLNEDNNIYHTNPIHISVFNCGQNRAKPFMVTVDEPRDLVNGNKMELAQEMMSIIVANKQVLMSTNNQKTFKNRQERTTYISRRESIENRLNSIIKDMQNMWLKEWRCLLSGKYVDESLEQRINDEIEKFFKSECSEVELTDRTRALLSCVIKCVQHLKLLEVKKAVQYCFPQAEDKNVFRNIVEFLRKASDETIAKSSNTKKHPVILIIDDSLDCFPWEMIDVLLDEPVSRLPSLHFAYSLFKEHESDLVNGYKIVSHFDKGTYVVNPETDLKKMEVRIMNFFKYWTPNWIGASGRKPSSDEFFELLTSSDIFSYNGHGNGSHLFSIDKLQSTRVKAVVLLFGCGSVRIQRLDPQVEMYGPYHMYLIAQCPCVVGMLWAVTDLDTDVLNTEFMSRWIPSKAPIHWRYIDRSKWNKATDKILFVRDSSIVDEDIQNEPDLLRALSMSKKAVSYFCTKSACVARGIPVKIQTFS